MSPDNSPISFPWRPAPSGQAAFTIVELLAVMAIMTLMLVAIVPAVNNIKGAGEVTNTAFEIATTLEQARAYAMAHNTYVFVGLSPRDGVDTTKAGTGEIVLAVAASRDGTKNFGPSDANLAPLARLRRISNMAIEDALPNTASMSRPVVADNYRLGNAASDATTSFKWPLNGGTSLYEFSKIIQFDPRGTATIPPNVASVPQWLEIGLVGARGNQVVASQNCAAVVLDGVTGSVKIYRP